MADFGIRRIVIACDAVSDNRAAIGTAALLAALWNVALEAVFVEDRELLRILSLPLTRHVGIPEAASDPATIAGRIEASAAQARETIAAAAKERGVGWSFAVASSHPALAPRGADEDAILIAEVDTRAFAGHWRPESVWLEAILRADRTTLLVRRGMNRHGSVIALVRSAAESAHQAVAAAAQLAAKSDRALTLLLDVQAPPAGEATNWVRRVDPAVAARCRVERIAARPDALARALAGHGGDMLVLDADRTAMEPARLRNLVAATEADVLLVR